MSNLDQNLVIEAMTKVSVGPGFKVVGLDHKAPRYLSPDDARRVLRQALEVAGIDDCCYKSPFSGTKRWDRHLLSDAAKRLIHAAGVEASRGAPSKKRGGAVRKEVDKSEVSITVQKSRLRQLIEEEIVDYFEADYYNSAVAAKYGAPRIADSIIRRVLVGGATPLDG